jgi:hypothetical protein
MSGSLDIRLRDIPKYENGLVFGAGDCDLNSAKQDGENYHVAICLERESDDLKDPRSKEYRLYVRDLNTEHGTSVVLPGSQPFYQRNGEWTLSTSEARKALKDGTESSVVLYTCPGAAFLLNIHHETIQHWADRAEDPKMATGIEEWSNGDNGIPEEIEDRRRFEPILVDLESQKVVKAPAKPKKSRSAENPLKKPGQELTAAPFRFQGVRPFRVEKGGQNANANLLLASEAVDGSGDGPVYVIKTNPGARAWKNEAVTYEYIKKALEELKGVSYPIYL